MGAAPATFHSCTVLSLRSNASTANVAIRASLTENRIARIKSCRCGTATEARLLIKRRERIFALVQAINDDFQTLTPANCKNYSSHLYRLTKLEGDYDTIQNEILVFDSKLPSTVKVGLDVDKAQRAFDGLVHKGGRGRGVSKVPEFRVRKVLIPYGKA